MEFDEKKLKDAVETIQLPEETKERLMKTCRSAEAGRWGRAPRKALIAGLAAALSVCILAAVGVGLARSGAHDDPPPMDVPSAMESEGTSAAVPSKPEASGTEASGTEEPVHEPPAMIILDSSAELAEMREMAVCTDEDALYDYLWSLKGMGASSRGDLTAFLELLDSLPYLPVLEGEISSIRYTPERQHMEIVTKAANGDWLRLIYFLSVQDIHAEIEAWKKEEPDDDSILPEPFVCCGGRIKVYREVRVAKPGAFLLCWDIEADGIFIRVDFCPADLNADRVVMEELFAGLTVKSVAELG